jgi:bacterioferritin
MLKYDLELEYEVIANLKDAIASCESCGDYQSRKMLGVLLKDTEEDHTFMLETQIGLIDKMGIENYIQSKE